jgi:para-nitrobenzyl esterase
MALLQAGNELSKTRILTFAPSIGTKTVPRQAGESLRAGEFLRVPMLIGGARDELRLYIGYDEQAGRHVTRANYAEKIAGYYGALAPQVLGEYPLPEDASPPAFLGSLLSDYNPFVGISNCLYLQTASTLARHSPVFEFEFSDPDALVLGVGMVALPDPHFPMGAVHSAMLNYLFPHMSNTAKIDAPDLPIASQRLSDTMVKLWSQFAAVGVPAAPGVPAWPRYTGDATVMRLEPGRIGLFDAAAAHRCSFWRGLYPDRLESGILTEAPAPGQNLRASRSSPVWIF